jgi:hypothetical protein
VCDLIVARRTLTSTLPDDGISEEELSTCTDFDVTEDLEFEEVDFENSLASDNLMSSGFDFASDDLRRLDTMDESMPIML